MSVIVSIGELLWDVYSNGEKVAGGAPFNFAFHCRQLGHDAVIVSAVGKDALGDELRAEVRRLGMRDDFIETDPRHPTGTVRVAVDAHGQPTYTVAENVAWDFIGDGSLKLPRDTAAVCFGTLAQRNPHGSSRSTIRQLVGPGPGMPTALRVFDVNLRPTGPPLDAVTWGVEHSDWIKLNEAELEAVAGAEGRWTGDADFTGLTLFSSCQVVIVTKGGNGVSLCHQADLHREPPVPAKVVDTVGAGDSFTAAMVCLHLEGRPLRDCTRFASHYAARVCEHRGATPRIDRGEVERAAFGTPR